MYAMCAPVSLLPVPVYEEKEKMQVECVRNELENVDVDK